MAGNLGGKEGEGGRDIIGLSREITRDRPAYYLIHPGPSFSLFYSNQRRNTNLTTHPIALFRLPRDPPPPYQNSRSGKDRRARPELRTRVPRPNLRPRSPDQARGLGAAGEEEAAAPAPREEEAPA